MKRRVNGTMTGDFKQNYLLDEQVREGVRQADEAVGDWAVIGLKPNGIRNILAVCRDQDEANGMRELLTTCEDYCELLVERILCLK